MKKIINLWKEQKTSSDKIVLVTAPLIFSVLLPLLCYVIFLDIYKYKHSTVPNTIKICNEIVREETSGRSSYDVFYYNCTDKSGKFYTINADLFNHALPNEEYDVDMVLNVKTKYAHKSDPDSIFCYFRIKNKIK